MCAVILKTVIILQNYIYSKEVFPTQMAIVIYTAHFQKEDTHYACKTDTLHTMSMCLDDCLRIQTRFPLETITSCGVIKVS